MQDYYSILKVSKDASENDIRKAYKKLAFVYHPDRNPDPNAEEEFKLLNEAYQTLSNPQKKASYDANLLYKEFYKSRPTTTYSSPENRKPYTGPHKRPNYAKRRTKYIIDEQYFRIQKIILGIFILLIGTAFGSYQLKMYFRDQAEIEALILENKMIDSLHTELNNRHIDQALVMVFRFIEENPLNYRFYEKKDSVLQLVEERAERMYQLKDFEESARMYALLRKYNNYQRPRGLEPLVYSFIRTNQPDSAFYILEEILRKDTINVMAHYMMARIYFEELGNLDQAKFYIDHSKRIFKKIQIENYGKAYELVMDVSQVGDIFYEIFELRARINIEEKNYSDAYTDANWLVFLRPDWVKGYEYRIICAVNSTERSTLCYDIGKAKSLNSETDLSNYQVYCNNDY